MSKILETKSNQTYSALRPRATGPRESDDYWMKIDDQFQQVTEAAKTAFKLNKNINVILVIVGVIFIANAILYSWFRESDLWNTLLGAAGIGTVVVIFFINSQSNVNKAVSSLAQIFMIYKAHSREYETITDYDYEKQQQDGPRDLNEVKEMNNELERSTQFYTDLVNSNLQAFKQY
jgi:hypothetical protein